MCHTDRIWKCVPLYIRKPLKCSRKIWTDYVVRFVLFVRVVIGYALRFRCEPIERINRIFNCRRTYNATERCSLRVVVFCIRSRLMELCLVNYALQWDRTEAKVNYNPLEREWFKQIVFGFQAYVLLFTQFCAIRFNLILNKSEN